MLQFQILRATFDTYFFTSLQKLWTKWRKFQIPSQVSLPVNQLYVKTAKFLENGTDLWQITNTQKQKTRETLPRHEICKHGTESKQVWRHWPVEVKLEKKNNTTSSTAKLLSFVLDPEADRERVSIFWCKCCCWLWLLKLWLSSRSAQRDRERKRVRERERERSGLFCFTWQVSYCELSGL